MIYVIAMEESKLQIDKRSHLKTSKTSLGTKNDLIPKRKLIVSPFEAERVLFLLYSQPSQRL